MKLEVGKLYKVVRKNLIDEEMNRPVPAAAQGKIVWIPQGTWLLIANLAGPSGLPQQLDNDTWCWCIYNETIIVISSKFLNRDSGCPSK